MKIINVSVVALVLSVFTGTANALPILSFDDDAFSQNGVVSYDGAGGALVGSGIDFVSVTGFDTPSNSGSVLTCVSCVLSFATGANITEGPGSWLFAGGGSLTITGTVMDGLTQVATGNLVTGSFDSALAFGTGSTLLFSGFGIDTKNQSLIEFFGLTGVDFAFASTDISLGGAIIDPITQGFTANVTNADFDNTVPEPSMIALMSLGLVGLGIAGRRKKA